MWGTTRSNLQQKVLGVTEGHSAILRLVGVGYRAMIENDGRLLSMKLGFSHNIELEVPEGVKCTVPSPTRILLEGCNKSKVRQFASKIRAWRVPEPYKGKVCLFFGVSEGISAAGELILIGHLYRRRDYQAQGKEGQIDGSNDDSCIFIVYCAAPFTHEFTSRISTKHEQKRKKNNTNS
jgi:Ribosomal protein L6